MSALPPKADKRSLLRLLCDGNGFPWFVRSTSYDPAGA